MANVAKRSFAGGEITSKMHARTDQVKFSTGLRTCRNFEVLRHGGLQNRRGFEFCVEVKTAEKDTVLRKFKFNDAQTYILEFGDKYMRIIQDGVYVRVFSGFVWTTATAYLQGDLVIVGAIYYYAMLAHVSGATTQPGVGIDTGSHWHMLTGDIYEIPSPHDAEDLRNVKYAQSADVITLTHFGYPIYELRREGLTRWRFVKIAPTPPLGSPTNLALSGGTVGAILYYAATAVRPETGEEGLAAVVSAINRMPTLLAPTVFTLTPIPEATDYNVYRSTDGVTFGHIGRAAPVQVPTSETVWIRNASVWSFATPNNTWVTDTDDPSTITVWAAGAEKSTTGKYTIRGRSTVIMSTGGALYSRILVKMSRDNEPQFVLGAFDLPIFRTSGGGSKERIFSIEVNVPDNGFNQSLALYIYPQLLRLDAGSVQHHLSFATAPDNQITWSYPSALGFTDYDALPDYSIAPPVQRDILNAPSNYPNVVGFFSQRRMFANSLNEPEKTWVSKVGGYNTFMIGTPTKDDDSNVFSLAGQEVNEIRAFLDLNGLILFTASGEYKTQSVIPGRTAPERLSQYGIVMHLSPLLVGNSAMFVQARGSTIYNLSMDAIESSKSQDVTVFASHLFEDYSITAWDFQRVPNPVVWAVRNDGILLGLTVMPEHEVLGWHRHDTNGVFKDVCIIPENNRDSVYVLVDRLINGVTRRFIERKIQGDVASLGFVDAGIAVNKAAAIAAGILVIQQDTSGRLTVAHLEAMQVAISGGPTQTMLAGRSNTALPLRTVTGGVITLTAQELASYADFWVGLPYVSDFETLDIDTFQTSNKVKKILVNRVVLMLESSRNLFVGQQAPTGIDLLENLLEGALRDSEGYNDDPNKVYTDSVNVDIEAAWNSNGRIFARHVDPTPCTILAAVPQGHL